jgi:hypothetical protein
MLEPSEVQYMVLTNGVDPYLLARVRWPDVAQAISAECLEWQEDPGLFDLPTDPSGVRVTPDEAAEIAAGWGVNLFSDDAFHASGGSLIRRMPADWSNLAPAEVRAWSLDFVDRERRGDVSRKASRVGARNTSAGAQPSRGRWRFHSRKGAARRADFEPRMRPANLNGSPADALGHAPNWGLVMDSPPSSAVLGASHKVEDENGNLPNVAPDEVLDAGSLLDLGVVTQSRNGHPSESNGSA